MTDLATKSEPQLMHDLLMHALRVRDEQLNAIASELLSRFGIRPVRQLILVATNTKNPTGQRVRALEVLGRIGPPYGMELMDLCALRHSRNKSVREAACKLVGLDAMLGREDMTERPTAV